VSRVVVHERPALTAGEAARGTFGVPLGQLIADILANKDGMLDRLAELSRPEKEDDFEGKKFD